MVRGKTAESIKVASLFKPERIGAVTHYYNSQSVTTRSGYGFDTQPYDDVVVAIHVGTMDGPAGATLLNSILASSQDNPATAVAVTGCSFSNINSASDEVIRFGALKTKDHPRYLFLDTEVQNADSASQAVTLDFSALVIGGKPDEQATSMTYDYDV